MEAAELIVRIYEAFSSAPRPGRNQITPHRCWECDEVRDRLIRHESRNVPASDMEWLGDSLPLLSPSALRYFVPRYLEFSITNPDSNAAKSVLCHLADEHPEERYWRERYSIFSVVEREAIVEYLRYRETLEEAEYERPWLERGIQYWSAQQGTEPDAG